ncbi:Centromere protein V [Pitangus sulphuratus]|nr:Centromere protein V [Pitangus sulphuratus]
MGRCRQSGAAAGGTRRARGRNAGGSSPRGKAEPPRAPGPFDLGAQSGRWAAFQKRHGLSCEEAARLLLDAYEHRGLVKHTGGCHCGAVRFEVWASPDLHVFNCNYVLIQSEISARDFRCCSFGQNFRSQSHAHAESVRRDLGADNLTTYTFNTHRAQHTFCKTCGVQSFYTPRSNPDGYGIAPHCLDDGTVQTIITEDINGKEWEKAVKEHKTIRDMSKP